MPKLSRNSDCPCGSGLKFKKCCMGKIPWDELLRGPASNFTKFQSARGKNKLFVGRLVAALQLDKISKHGMTRSDFKRAFTPDAVRQIYEAIVDLWPNKQVL